MNPIARASRRSATALLVALAASALWSSAGAQLTRRGIVAERDVRRLLTTLAADSMEGRATGTRGSARAATFIAEEMRRMGLEPAGDSGYFQRVPVAVTTQSRTMPNGTVVTRTRPTLFPSFAALDSVPVERRRTAVNVVGLIRGSDPVLRDSVVLVDAHYDHLGVGAPVGGDSIYNGADDDASGVVAVLESARAMAAGPAPKRTVLFVATTGEEVGLLGTRWFIDHPVVPLSRLVANLEIEMIGRPDSLAGGPGRAWLTGYERSTMGPTFAAAGLPVVADRRLDQQFFMRSDNIAFAQKGIPAHTLSSYNMHGDYHRPSDDASGVDFEHMTAVVRATAAATRLLADGPAPQWNPGGRPTVALAPRPTTPTPLPVNPPQLQAATPAERLGRYTTVRLAPDTTSLTRWERRMLPLLVDAAREMHGVYWTQAFGSRDSLLRNIPQADVRRLAEINVGPWDRLDDNAPFVPGTGPKPKGANFYPRDMTREEFERETAGGGARADSLKSLYTMVRRDASGRLAAIPYSRFFSAANERAAIKLRQAASLAEDAGLRRYLTLLATSLTTDRYRPSDLAWMDMKR
ncbi:MAG TPA: M20/M25/M40 family metallo-hydrolase, partial [Gemmatimonadaceae bacterium]|nr:M20/M25/M40 family metallo-hydrolase [Gemmatimonadaceae bacterium]